MRKPKRLEDLVRLLEEKEKLYKALAKGIRNNW